MKLTTDQDRSYVELNYSMFAECGISSFNSANTVDTKTSWRMRLRDLIESFKSRFEIYIMYIFGVVPTVLESIDVGLVAGWAGNLSRNITMLDHVSRTSSTIWAIQLERKIWSSTARTYFLNDRYRVKWILIESCKPEQIQQWLETWGASLPLTHIWRAWHCLKFEDRYKAVISVTN